MAHRPHVRPGGAPGGFFLFRSCARGILEPGGVGRIGLVALKGTRGFSWSLGWGEFVWEEVGKFPQKVSPRFFLGGEGFVSRTVEFRLQKKGHPCL